MVSTQASKQRCWWQSKYQEDVKDTKEKGIFIEFRTKDLNEEVKETKVVEETKNMGGKM